VVASDGIGGLGIRDLASQLFAYEGLEFKTRASFKLQPSDRLGERRFTILAVTKGAGLIDGTGPFCAFWDVRLPVFLLYN